VHDPAVADSVNVATTLAGLENAVAATATRVEPFPYFRDYATAMRAMVFWLPPSGGTGEFTRRDLQQGSAHNPLRGLVLPRHGR
jgi:hypothetical protein